jgi:hypothetical protein
MIWLRIDAVHDENMTRFARAKQHRGTRSEAALDDRRRRCRLQHRARRQSDTRPRGRAFIDLPVDSRRRTVDPQALDRPITFAEESTIVRVTGPTGSASSSRSWRGAAVTHVMSR